MKYHIALSWPTDLAGFEREARAGRGPRHSMGVLSQRLGAAVHQPTGHPVLPIDAALASIVGRPEHWALARSLSHRLSASDLIFCTGEDVGLPIAALAGARANRPKIAIQSHNLDRPRGRAALRLFRVAQRVDLFVTCECPQRNFLRRFMRLPEAHVRALPDQTDTAFFTPGPPSPEKRRPVIASVGLEQRDHRTLAEATTSLNVDVRISAFSWSASRVAKIWPGGLPPNMSVRFYAWPELVQLYRDADVVAIPLFDNKWAAGSTALLEAMACCRPVIVTRTRGLSDYLAKPDIATTVAPRDAGALQTAVVELLNDRHAAEAQAERGYEWVRKYHASERYLEMISAQLTSL